MINSKGVAKFLNDTAIDKSKQPFYFYRHAVDAGTLSGIAESNRTRSLILKQQIDPFFSNQNMAVSMRNMLGTYRISPEVSSQTKNHGEEIEIHPVKITCDRETEACSTTKTSSLDLPDFGVGKGVLENLDEKPLFYFRRPQSLDDKCTQPKIENILEDVTDHDNF